VAAALVASIKERQQSLIQILWLEGVKISENMKKWQFSMVMSV
jgi:hypothetical protein